MRIVPGSALGEALVAWMRQENVSVAHVVRVSGVAQNTIRQIILGTTQHPKTETLHALARAIATHPWTGDLEGSVSERCYRDFAVLAGYAPLETGVGASLLLLALTRHLSSRARAVAWLALIDEYAGLAAEEVRELGRGRAIARRARSPES